MNYLITGGTGLIGQNLIQDLVADGHTVVNLTRGDSRSEGSVRHLNWNGKSIPDDTGVVDVVINLAGANIAGKRWSDSYKELLMSSRVDATQACAEFIRQSAQKPIVFVSASGYNYYGDLVKAPVDESSPAGNGFMAEICKNWEAAAADTGVRTAFLRTAAVMAKEDGPLAKMLTPYKLFAGGPTGTGKQGFPWIHIRDMVRGIRFIVDTAGISGPVNMTNPAPITNQKFSNTLAKVLNRPNFMRLSKGMLNLIFGEMSVVLWGGAFVQPKVLQEYGFEWEFPDLEPALRDLLNRPA